MDKSDNKYHEALHLYTTTELKATEICRQLNVSYHSFRAFLKGYHPELINRRYVLPLTEYNREKKKNTEAYYRKALKLYSTTTLSIKEIAMRSGVSLSGFKTYIYKYHRKLMLERHEISMSRRGAKGLKLRSKKNPKSVDTYEKYKEAVSACDNAEYIEYTITEIGRIFKLPDNGLNKFLHRHHPEIIERRNKARAAMGIPLHHVAGVRNVTTRQYAPAIELLKDPFMTIPEAAEKTNVSYTALKEYLLAYHKDLVKDRAEAREKAIIIREEERKMNKGAAKKINEATKEKYAPAIAALKAEDSSVEKIAGDFNLEPVSFRTYLKRHEPELFSRYGRMKLEGGKTVSARSFSKYKDALEELERGKLTLKEIAAKYNLKYNSFTSFVRRNPRLRVDENTSD